MSGTVPGEQQAQEIATTLLSAMAPIWLLEGPLLILIFVLLSAFEAAVYRWLVRNERPGGFLGLSLGADTWRVFLCYLLWLAVWVGLILACVITSALLIGGASAAFGKTNGGLVALFVFIDIVAVVGAIFVVMIRLAPAAALSVGQQRFAFFDAWKASRGKGWSMFGAYLIIAVIAMVAEGLIGGVFAFSLMGPLIGLAASGAQPTPEQMFATIFSVQNAILVVIFILAASVIRTMLMLAFMGVAAAAARAAIAERAAAPAAA
jgi:hypothetical protein